jgi:hypothetical protein
LLTEIPAENKIAFAHMTRLSIGQIDRLGLASLHQRLIPYGGMVEQPLHPVRSAITSVLGEGPPILPGKITDQPRDVLPGLLKRLHPAKAGPQPPVQLGQIRHRQPTSTTTAAAASPISRVTT